MPDGPPSHELLPSSFFEGLIRDVPVETWSQLLNSNPTLKALILEGFTVPAGKLGRILRKPQIVARLQRLSRSEETFFDEILQLWAQERLSTVAFLEMLDRDFVLDNWQSLKNFLGPERLFAGLQVLGYLAHPEFQNLIGEDFWERHLDGELLIPLAPVWELWHDLVQQFPQAKNWLPHIRPGREEGAEERRQAGAPTQGKQLRASEERCAKLRMRFDKLEEEKSHLHQELIRCRKEQDELRTRMAELEKTRDQELQKALAEMRHRWFKRYQMVDEPAFGEADGLLESLLQRTEQAFVLQQQADEEYGLVAAVRRKLLQVDRCLDEIERIYAESLVVHSEVARAKEALLQAKEKLLRLPGIHKVLRPDSPSLTVTDLRQQIRLLEPIPENLPAVTELYTLMARLADLGLITDPQAIQEDVEHKKHQIMENLYAQYQMFQEQRPRARPCEDLDELVKSRDSKRYDLYVDGYNILFKLHGRNHSRSDLPLTALRERFTAAVVRKSQFFRRIYLVFDGQVDSRDRDGNAEIIFTDKGRGNTADSYIIQSIQKRKDRLVLLATGDREIIGAVGDRIYALVDPYHFYLFVHDMPFPELV